MCKKKRLHQLDSKSVQTSEQLKLQQRLNKLSTENLVLRQHLKVVYGMSDSQLVRTVESLQVENGELKRQLQELNVNNYTTIISNQVNRQLNERIYALEMEKAELLLKVEQLTQQNNQFQLLDNELNSLKSAFLNQSEQIKLLQAQLKSANSELIKCQSSPSNESKFNLTSSATTPQNEISCELKKQLSELGINLNSALTKLILNKTDEQIVHALSIVRDYVARGEVKKSKAGIFRRALEENWSSTEPSIEITVNTNSRLIFNEWYTLARKLGIVQDYREEEGVTMVQDNTGHWFTFEEFSNKWTLDYLKRRQNPHK